MEIGTLERKKRGEKKIEPGRARREKETRMGSITIPATLQEETVHCIPSKTTYSGPARVHSYFQPSVDVEQQKLQTAGTAQGANSTAFGNPQIAAFRGRTLRGAEVLLPEGFSGV